jgi:hypothetical protein
MPEISGPWAPDADLRQVGLLWVDLSQVDGIALPPAEEVQKRWLVTVRVPQRTRDFDR